MRNLDRLNKARARVKTAREELAKAKETTRLYQVRVDVLNNELIDAVRDLDFEEIAS